MKLIATKRKIENEHLKVTVGTTNKKKPVTFYIEFNGTASLTSKDKYTDELMKDLSTVIKKIASSITAEYHMEKCSISDIDFSEESLKNGKEAYITIQFYFMQLFTTDFVTLCEVCEKMVDKYVPVIKDKLLEHNIEIRKIR